MSATILTITLSDSSTVVIDIPAALQGLDSGAQANQQTGFSAADELIRSIFRAGVFKQGSTWYPVSQIKTIVAS